MAKSKKRGQQPSAPRPKCQKNKPTQNIVVSSHVKAPTVSTESRERPSAGQLAEQSRANYALAALEKAIENSDGERVYKHSELKSYIRRLPGMIQINGFGQAVAFYYSKRESSKAYGAVYKIIENWLCRDGQIYANAASGEHRLLKAITSNDQLVYRRAQAETQALMRWLKTFAEALIIKGDSGEHTTNG